MSNRYPLVEMKIEKTTFWDNVRNRFRMLFSKRKWSIFEFWDVFFRFWLHLQTIHKPYTSCDWSELELDATDWFTDNTIASQWSNANPVLSLRFLHRVVRIKGLFQLLCMVCVWFVYGLCMVWYVTPDQWFSLKKSTEKKVDLDRVKTRF